MISPDRLQVPPDEMIFCQMVVFIPTLLPANDIIATVGRTLFLLSPPMALASRPRGACNITVHRHAHNDPKACGATQQAFSDYPTRFPASQPHRFSSVTDPTQRLHRLTITRHSHVNKVMQSNARTNPAPARPHLPPRGACLSRPACAASVPSRLHCHRHPHDPALPKRRRVVPPRALLRHRRHWEAGKRPVRPPTPSEEQQLEQRLLRQQLRGHSDLQPSCRPIHPRESHPRPLL